MVKLTLLLSLLISGLVCAQTKVDLAHQSSPAIIGNGTNGQVLIADGSGNFTPGDPIVSLNYVNLFNAISAGVSQTSSKVRISNFGTSGTLYVTWASITGSPNGCTLQLNNVDSLGNTINTVPAISVSPANGTSTFSISPLGALKTAAQLQVVYNCSSFPVSGTLTVDFVPAVPTFTAFGYPNILGCYAAQGRTATYSGQAAGVPLVSMRWAPATTTQVALIFKVSVLVETTTAATAVGPVERELIGSTSYTAADTGGTSLGINKLDPNYPSSAVNALSLGNGILTAGTRTLNSSPYSSVLAWLPLNMTGVDIGGACGNAISGTAVAWNCQGGTGPIDLWNATNNQNMPIVLRNNNGLHIRIGKDAMPTSAVQRTSIWLMWCEATQYNAAQ